MAKLATIYQHGGFLQQPHTMKHLFTSILAVLFSASVLQGQIITLVADCVCEGNPQQAFAVAAGSTAPFVLFEWSGPEGYTSFAQNPTDIELPGQYTLSAENMYGCVFEYKASVEGCAGPGFEFEVLPASDCNGDDGQINLALSGGAPPFTYQWYAEGLPEGTADVYENASAGVAYQVAVTDATGCTFIEPAPDVLQLPPLSLLVQSTASACAGTSTGSAALDADGGKPPYVFSWSTGASTDQGVLGGLAPGNYSVTVTDAAGCFAEAAFSVSEAEPPLVSVGQETLPSCSGASDGSIELAVAPVGAYSVVWDNGQSGLGLLDVPAGTYTASVTSGAGCTVVFSASLAEPGPLAVSVDYVVPASCAAIADGVVRLEVLGGTPPYVYSWDGGSGSSSVISGLSTGAHDISVEDSMGCSESISVFVPAGAPPALSFGSSGVTCENGPDGSVFVNVAGGAGGYTFNWWSTDYPDFSATGPVLSGLPAGTYCVEALSSEGCGSTACHTLELQSSKEHPYLKEVKVSVQDPASGSLVPIYIGRWKKGAGCIFYEAEESVEITDEAFAWIDAGQPLVVEAVSSQPMVGLSLSVQGSSVNMNPNNPALNIWGGLLIGGIIENGLIDVRLHFTGMGTNGLPLLDLRAMSNDLSECAALPEQQGDCTFLPLPQVGVDDVHHLQKQCFSEHEMTVAAVAYAAQGDCNGSVTLALPSPSLPSQLVMTGSGQQSAVVGANSEYTFGGLCPGTYVFAAEDANGCGQEVTVEVGSCGDFTVLPIIANATACDAEDGSIVLPQEGLSGGMPPYRFVWSNGAEGESNSGLSPGMYSVTMTDALGCSAVFSYTIGQESASPYGGNDFLVDIVGIVDDTDNSCNGSITVSVFYTGFSVRLNLTGPGAPWQNVELTSPWPDPVDQSYTFDGLCAAEYTIAASYEYVGKKCVIPLFAEVEACPGFSLAEGTTILKPSGCGSSDGSISLPSPALLGGAAPYIWQWSTGAQSSVGISNLSAGHYGLTVVDANGCSLVRSFDLSLPSDASTYEVVEIRPAKAGEGCSGEILIAGVPGMSVQVALFPETLDYLIPSSGELLVTGLCPGDYTLTFSDEAGCEHTEQVSISACGELSLPALINLQPPSDCGATDGAIGFTDSPSGGTPPYMQYLIDETGNTVQMTTVGGYSDFHSLAEGSYTYLVEDSEGCSNKQEIEVVSQSTPTLMFFDEPLSTPECEGLANGTIGFYVGTGQGATVFSVSMTHTNSDMPSPVSTIFESGSLVVLDGLVWGDYEFVIQVPGSGCHLEFSVYVEEIPSEGVFQMSGAEPVTAKKSCPFQPTGEIGIMLEGGNPPYRAAISGPGGFKFAFSSTADPYLIPFGGLPAGTYTIVRLSDDCDREIDPADLPPPIVIESFPEMEFTAQIAVCCPGLSDIAVSVAGGTLPYSYAWSNGAATAALADIDAGNYALTVTDSEGCFQSEAYSVDAIAPFEVSMAQGISYACDYVRSNGLDAGNIGQIVIGSISGGMPLGSSQNVPGCGYNQGVSANFGNYRVQWSNGVQGEEAITGLAPGDYRLSVTDGCTERTFDFAIYEQDVVEGRAFGTESGAPETTCWNEVTCGAFIVDAVWGGVRNIDRPALEDDSGDCGVDIVCENNRVIWLPGTIDDEGVGLGDQLYKDGNGKCKCENRKRCTIGTDYEDRVVYTVNVEGVSNETFGVEIISVYEEETFTDPLETSIVDNAHSVSGSDCNSPSCDPNLEGCVFQDSIKCTGAADPEALGVCVECRPQTRDDCPENYVFDECTGCCVVVALARKPSRHQQSAHAKAGGSADGQEGGSGFRARHYPNPFHTSLSLELYALYDAQAEIKLFNALGVEAVSTTFGLSAGDNRLELAGLSGLPPGIYWLRVRLPGEQPITLRAIKH